MTPANRAKHWLSWLFAVERGEWPALATAFLAAATLFGSYAVLRPIRDVMGITSGLSSMPALFWGTFIGMLAIQPLYGWLVGRGARGVMVPRIYLAFVAMLLGFWAWFMLQDDHTWIARSYFIWVSVFNLFVVSVFWSLMADVFTRAQAARLFGVIAGGISTGGLVGPLLVATLAQRIGTVNLLLVSATLLATSALLLHRIARMKPATDARPEPARAVLAGGAWDAFAQVARSPYLLAIAVFVLLLTFANTVVYLEQQRVVGAAIPDKDAQTAFMGGVDFWVQAGALLGQFLLFARFQRWLGFAVTLAIVPALMLLAFGALAASPTFAVVIACVMARRIGEYALVRPSRDMLFTVVSPGEKYRAKNLLDTFVYRGGDAMSATAFAAVTTAIASPSAGGLFGVAVAIAWLAAAGWLGRSFQRRAAAQASDVARDSSQASHSAAPRSKNASGPEGA
ncbi:MAG TPA: MFS transporter [Xanthomonadales bacterium]|nr:MFS transporter [Xanthomonadales bacterium]